MSDEIKKEDKARRDKLLELQTLDTQIKQYEEQLMQLEEQIFEINSIIENLIEIENTPLNTEILVPIANGIFVKAKISDKDNLKVNVGASVVVDKTSIETTDMLKEQLKQIETYKNDLFLQLQTLVKHASYIQADVLGDSS